MHVFFFAFFIKATTSTKEQAEMSVAPVPDLAPVEAAVSTCDTPAQVQQVNLCGRVELPEVKELLKEWTHTCPGMYVYRTGVFLKSLF